MAGWGSARESLRCALHPSRPAHDSCPVCTRPRCLADAKEWGTTGCLACIVTAAVRAEPTRLELVVRSGLAGLAVAYLGGWVATQYVRVHLMSLAAPAVVGLAAAWAVPRAARRLTPALAWSMAVAAALVGTALGFALTPGGQNPLSQWGVVTGPYLAAVAGVVAGPLVLGAPRDRSAGRRRRQPLGDGEGEDVGTDL